MNSKMVSKIQVGMSTTNIFTQNQNMLSFVKAWTLINGRGR